MSARDSAQALPAQALVDFGIPSGEMRIWL